MTLLIFGVLLWSVLHFVPILAQPVRAQLKSRLGEGGYRAVFSIGIVTAIVIMVLGWRSGEQLAVYDPPIGGQAVGGALIFVAFLLFGLAKAKTNVKRIIRHPQLMAIVLWAAGHLLANGDNLSLALFGGLGLWALIEMALINRRDGSWQKPEPVALSSEVRPLVIGTVIFAVFFFAHPYLFGVSPVR